MTYLAVLLDLPRNAQRPRARTLPEYHQGRHKSPRPHDEPKLLGDRPQTAFRWVILL
jgi:hypothetical protein